MKRADILVYSFLVSIALHLMLFVPWTQPEKIEKRPETIPVSYRTIAKKETQPPAPEKAKDKPVRAKGLPQPSPPAVQPPSPPAPPPKPAPKPEPVEKPVALAQQSSPPPPPPPPPPKPEAKPQPQPAPVKPAPKETPAPVAKELAPAKNATEPAKEKIVEKKATQASPKQAEVKKEVPKPKPQKARKPVKKKRVAKKPPAKTKKSKARKKATPRKTQETAVVKKQLPTLKELLPTLSGSGRVASGSHGNEYISMDSRDPMYSSWLASLQRAIYRTWLPTYPSGNISGEVLLGLMIKKDGDLAHVEVLRSSGLALLDRHAMESVRAAAPFSRFPPWMTQDQQGIKATFTYGGTPGNVWGWQR